MADDPKQQQPIGQQPYGQQPPPYTQQSYPPQQYPPHMQVPPPQQQPVRMGMSGTTQVITAAIGAIATVSGALIAANWGRGHSAEPAPQHTMAQGQADMSSTGRSVFPPLNQGGTRPNPLPTDGDDGDDGSDTSAASSPLGDWRGAQGGALFRIAQNSDGSVIIGGQMPTPQGMLMLRGMGTMDAGTVSWDYQNNAGMSGHCEAQLSGDGHALQGGCRNADGSATPVNLVR